MSRADESGLEAYEEGYEIGFRQGRLEVCRELVLDVARTMASKASAVTAEPLSDEEAGHLSKLMIAAAQRLLWEEAKRD